MQKANIGGCGGLRHTLTELMENYFIKFVLNAPLFNQVGQLRTSSHLQLRPGQDKAKQYDKTTVTHGINKHTVNNTIEKSIYSVCKWSKIREVRQ